ncbi:glycosyltransferase family 4 protein [Iningainema tapete]|uniref:Glycosyltransferase family 4 protein n=1 Tax=Iningainema tapete BLCC-T55 TaxID=2748662 RepID=A0A8J6XU21_9CYAN|nr:glycosyltransferase family 1 protein [Iningainema tapete]MBD2778474.1 glycosyltransferase family 4 protein [Iningainema tapete BLCC-T55]
MKVLYDISVLGVGYYNQAGRTGIFRVVENLAEGLKKSQECELFFCINGEIYKLYDAVDYLESNLNLAGVPLAYQAKDWRFKYNTHKLLSKLSFKVDNSTNAKQIWFKIFRKFVYYTHKITNYLPTEISPKVLAETNIYHSPFEAIPQKIKRTSHVKHFLTVHDLIPILYPEFFKFNENTPLKKAIESLEPESWVICISQSTKEDLCNYAKLVDPSRVFVINLGASDLFYPCTDSQTLERTRMKYGIPNVPYFLSLSTLEPRKNVDHTIRCFANLVQQEKIQDLCLVLVGTKGWNYDKIFAEISHNPALKDRIIVTGYVADEDLAALYSGARAFVYTSLYEGFGLPPLEAMQCGIPVITSNTSSLPEVVGDAGIMLEPKDVDGLCHSLLKLYNQPDLRQSMSQKSLEQAQKFSWEKCTQQTIAAYKTALSA